MRTSRALALGLAAAGLALPPAQVVDAGGAAHQSSGVYHFADPGHDAGDATLTRNGSGVTMNISTTIGGELFEGEPTGVDWASGDATTVWFVVFNDPDSCTGGECGEDDVFDFPELSKVGVHHAAGNVAGGDTFHAAARLREGDMSGVLFGYGLMDAQAAEVHLVVRSHGPSANLTGQQLSYALHSVGGGCETNTCGDSQFAIFPPA